MARNLALACTGGSGWVFRLDGDDVLDVDGWVALVSDPRFGQFLWHPTNLVDMEGVATPHWFRSSRVWGVRQVEEEWSSPMPFHPNNIVVDASLALRSGGWPALEVAEDLLWCFTIGGLEEGLSLPHVTLRYRRWGMQTVASEGYLRSKSSAFRFAEGVVNARRAACGLEPVRAPAVGGASLYLDRGPDAGS